jgi:hypothetical protein
MKSALLLTVSGLLAGVFAQPPPHGCFVQTHETAYDLSPLQNTTAHANMTDTYLNMVYDFDIGFCGNHFKCGNDMGSVIQHSNGQCTVAANWPTNTHIYGNTSSDATALEFQVMGNDGRVTRYYIFCDPNEHLIVDNTREEPQNQFNFFMRSRFVCNAYRNKYQGGILDVASGASYPIEVEFNANGDIYVRIEGDLRDGVLAAYYFDRDYQNYVGALIDTDDREYLGDMILRPIQNGDRLDGTFYDKFENIYIVNAHQSN